MLLASISQAAGAYSWADVSAEDGTTLVIFDKLWWWWLPLGHVFWEMTQVLVLEFAPRLEKSVREAWGAARSHSDLPASSQWPHQEMTLQAPCPRTPWILWELWVLYQFGACSTGT